VVQTREQLDSRIRVVTPENIAFEYRLAGPFWRLPAYFLDLLIRLAIFGILFLCALLLFGSLGTFGVGILILFMGWLVLAWFYGGLFEAFWNGQTPGKRVMQLRVISRDGRPVSGLQAVLRNILRVVDALPAYVIAAEFVVPTYLVGLISAACGSRYQRLGDLVCGTIVVIEERPRMRGVERLDEPEIDAVSALLPAAWVPDRSLSNAVSKYVDRRKFFGPARRAEIARHVGSLLVKKLALPSETSYDALLCAAYQRSFHNEPGDKTLTRDSQPNLSDKSPKAVQPALTTDSGRKLVP
jgi:uncharacterized RDD family membrane protein YckC